MSLAFLQIKGFIIAYVSETAIYDPSVPVELDVPSAFGIFQGVHGNVLVVDGYMEDEIKTLPKIYLFGKYADEEGLSSEVLTIDIDPSFSEIHIRSSKNVSHKMTITSLRNN